RPRGVQPAQALGRTRGQAGAGIGAEAAAVKTRARAVHFGCALALAVVSSAEARAKDTGYVFVSDEKTNNVAVIDPKQDYKIIKWIPTSHRPRDMKFGDNHTLLYVACGDD